MPDITVETTDQATLFIFSDYLGIFLQEIKIDTFPAGSHVNSEIIQKCASRSEKKKPGPGVVKIFCSFYHLPFTNQ